MSLPQEIWDVVVKDLPSFSAKSAAETFEFELGNQMQAKHGRVWSNIFRDQSWAVKAREADLNPILVGSDLQSFYHQEAPAPAYLCIFLNGGLWPRAGQFQELGRTRQFQEQAENQTLFFECLQPYEDLEPYEESKYKPSAREVKLRCGVTLRTSNLFDMRWNHVDAIPTKVISDCVPGVRSYYLLWEDETYGLGELDSRVSWKAFPGRQSVVSLSPKQMRGDVYIDGYNFVIQEDKFVIEYRRRQTERRVEQAKSDVRAALSKVQALLAELEPQSW